jgi:hypothetical protein
MKGVFEFELDGKQVGFKLGTMALAIAEEKEGKSLKELLESLTSKDVKTITILNIFYGAAVQYADHKRKPIDFTLSDISDWCEEIGFEKLITVITEGLAQYVPKNLTSLAETGEKITG